MPETKTAETKRMKLEILEVKERQSVGEKGAIKLTFKAKGDDGEHWYYTFRSSLFETIEGGQGKTFEVDIEVKETEQWGTQRDIKQIYVEGQPVGGKKQGGWQPRGKSPEELELSRRSFALSYAKDLAVAKLIEVNDVLTTAEVYYRWLGAFTASIALKTTPKDAVKKTTTAVKSTTQETDIPAPNIEQAEHDSKELFPEGGSKGLGTKEPKGKIPKTQEQLFNYVAKHAKHRDTKFTKSFIINKFKIPEKRIDEDILGVYYEVKELMAWPEYDGE